MRLLEGFVVGVPVILCSVEGRRFDWLYASLVS